MIGHELSDLAMIEINDDLNSIAMALNAANRALSQGFVLDPVANAEFGPLFRCRLDRVRREVGHGVGRV